ncbi:MAG: hypothetical protein IKS41_04185, partial [Alphaproteobacteria bacterium]|nr:hypothetical protein [Alphaproteobacteria bacterium]
MFCKKIVLTVLTLTTALYGSVAYAGISPRDAVYQFAHRANLKALERIKDMGYDIDAVDKKGNTSLCAAVLSRDVVAYNTLVEAGADKKHDCMSDISADHKAIFCSNQDLRDRSICNDLPKGTIGTGAMIGGAAILGTLGAVAIAGGGGGGGGGSKESSSSISSSIKPSSSSYSSVSVGSSTVSSGSPSTTSSILPITVSTVPPIIVSSESSSLSSSSESSVSSESSSSSSSSESSVSSESSSLSSSSESSVSSESSSSSSSSESSVSSESSSSSSSSESSVSSESSSSSSSSESSVSSESSSSSSSSESSSMSSSSSSSSSSVDPCAATVCGANSHPVAEGATCACICDPGYVQKYDAGTYVCVEAATGDSYIYVKGVGQGEGVTYHEQTSDLSVADKQVGIIALQGSTAELGSGATITMEGAGTYIGMAGGNRLNYEAFGSTIVNNGAIQATANERVGTAGGAFRGMTLYGVTNTQDEDPTTDDETVESRNTYYGKMINNGIINFNQVLPDGDPTAAFTTNFWGMSGTSATNNGTINMTFESGLTEQQGYHYAMRGNLLTNNGDINIRLLGGGDHIEIYSMYPSDYTSSKFDYSVINNGNITWQLSPSTKSASYHESYYGFGDAQGVNNGNVLVNSNWLIGRVYGAQNISENAAGAKITLNVLRNNEEGYNYGLEGTYANRYWFGVYIGNGENFTNNGDILVNMVNELTENEGTFNNSDTDGLKGVRYGSTGRASFVNTGSIEVNKSDSNYILPAMGVHVEDDSVTNQAGANIDVTSYGGGDAYGIYQRWADTAATGDLLGTDIALTNSGTISVGKLGTTAQGNAYGIDLYYERDYLITNNAGAKIIVRQEGSGNAYGIIGDDYSATDGNITQIRNDGVIDVAATKASRKVRGIAMSDVKRTNTPILIENTGIIKVTASSEGTRTKNKANKWIEPNHYGSDVYGIYLNSGTSKSKDELSSITNTGRILVTNDVNNTDVAVGYQGEYNSHTYGIYAEALKSDTGNAYLEVYNGLPEDKEDALIQVKSTATKDNPGVLGTAIYHHGADTYGIYSTGLVWVYNYGRIEVEDTAGATMDCDPYHTYGIYADGRGVVENHGVISVKSVEPLYGDRPHYTYGIVGKNNAQIYNLGKIYVEGRAGTDSDGKPYTGQIRIDDAYYDDVKYDYLVVGAGDHPEVGGGMSSINPLALEGSSKFVNLGLLSTNTDMNLTTGYKAGLGGTTEAPAIAGLVGTDNGALMNNNLTTVTMKDAFISPDVSKLGVVSDSALFDAKLVSTSDTTHDVVMTMRGFDTATKNASLAEFLTRNYAAGKNEAFFNQLKSFGDVHSLTNSLDKLTGREMLSRFNFEDMTMM